jgi:hypothetical protein
MRSLAIFSASLLALSAPDAFATDVSEITADEYYAAAYFKSALDHPQVRKHGSKKKQIAAVARDIKWNEKKLAKAIDKVESLDGDPIDMAKTAIEGAFGGTKVGGRVLDVLINSEEPKHVVVYIRWQGSSAKEVVKEAAIIANVVSKQAPLISTLSLSAIHPKAEKSDKTSVWSGKIGKDAMARIDEKRIDAYAERLYKGLFEGVESRPF